MPRKERTVQRRQTLVAAARNYSTGRSEKKVAETRKQPGEAWQAAGWDFYDLIPEYHQGCAITGALLSRAKLIVLEKNAKGEWLPTENAVALEALDYLFGGPEGQVEMLRQFGIHFTVAGEGWIMAPSDPTDADDWLVAASTEVSKQANSGWKVGEKRYESDALAIRVWRRHPRNPRKADAPTRAILPVLSELNQLSKRIAAQIDSRLFGNGILFVPSETSFPVTPTKSLNPGDPEPVRDGLQQGDAQGLADLIYETGRKAITDPESAEAMLPLIAEAPGEYVDKVKHVTFASELDRMAPKMREELIRRCALGLDMPPEVLLGNSGSNHWNAWLSDENSVKVHAEPLLKLLTSSLTTGYLRKALEDEPGVTPENFMIGADTSQMRMRPNRSKEALELNDRLILSDDAALRENGFTEADRMDDEDRKRALIRKVAGGSTTPELVEAALRENGVDLDVIVSDRREPAEARPTPSLAEHPTREIPERQAAAANMLALTLVCEQIVDRALQRAGNRMKTKMGLRGSATAANRLYLAAEVAPSDLDDLLTDAWGPCHDFDYGVDGALIERALDMYTRSIIHARREPSRTGILASLKLTLGNLAA